MFILCYGYVAFEKPSCKYFINKLTYHKKEKKKKKKNAQNVSEMQKKFRATFHSYPRTIQGRSQCVDVNNHFKKFSNVFVLYILI